MNVITRAYCLLFLELRLFHMLQPAWKPVLLRPLPSSHPRGSWCPPFDLACHFSASSPFLWYSLWPLCEPGPQVSSYWDNSPGPCREYREGKRIPCRVQDYHPGNCWPVEEQRREDLRHAWGTRKATRASSFFCLCCVLVFNVWVYLVAARLLWMCSPDVPERVERGGSEGAQTGSGEHHAGLGRGILPFLG